MNKINLFAAAFIACFAVNANTTACDAQKDEMINTRESQEAFTPKKFTLTYTITCDANLSTQEFYSKAQTMRSLIQDGQSNNPSMYQKILIFIKELQEAIIAGFNIFGKATTEEIIVSAVGDVASEIVSQVEEFNAQTTIPTKGIVDTLTMSYSIVVDKIENLALWESVKEKMIALASALNQNNKPSEEISAMLEEIVKESAPLQTGVATLETSLFDKN